MLNTVEETAKDAGHTVGNVAGKVGHAASKAKVPLMAGGAALAGAAGGTRPRRPASASPQERLRRGQLEGPDEGGEEGRRASGLRVGELALEGRRAREARNGNGKTHRSPIEVVLESLTSRG